MHTQHQLMNYKKTFVTGDRTTHIHSKKSVIQPGGRSTLQCSQATGDALAHPGWMS